MIWKLDLLRLTCINLRGFNHLHWTRIDNLRARSKTISKPLGEVFLVYKGKSPELGTLKRQCGHSCSKPTTVWFYLTPIDTLKISMGIDVRQDFFLLYRLVLHQREVGHSFHSLYLIGL